MKVAFIEPSIAGVEPLGIAYLTQALLNAGHEVRYFEAPRGSLVERLKDFAPDVIAYSVATGKHRICRNLNAGIRREIDAVSLFGGPHCTFTPEFIETDPMIDGVCRGEGEGSIVELLGKMSRGEDYSRTAGWWLRIGGEIFKNPVREEDDDLDTLPFPNREVLYAENPGLRDTPIKRILGARGCPFSCSYCFNKKYNELWAGKGKIYRSRSVGNIVAEINEIRSRYPLSMLKFAEDVFGMDMDYSEFAEVYSREAGIPFFCNMRPNLIDDEKVRLIKKAGCAAVVLAVESGNEKIRNMVLNRKLSTEKMGSVIDSLRGAGIRVWTQNIIANPGETFEMAMETFEFNAAHNVEFSECFLLTPYPGTQIYEYCVKNGYFDGETDALQRSYWMDSPIRFDSEREKKRLVNFQKFFSFTVQHPGLLFIIKLLIELPPNKIFLLFNRLYDNWRISRTLRAKMSPKQFLGLAFNNLLFIKTFLLSSTNDTEGEVRPRTLPTGEAKPRKVANLK